MMLLPDPRRRGEIHFKLAKFLPYGARLALIVSGLAVGFGLQFVTLKPWIGAPFVLVASLLSLVSGYTNIAKTDEGKLDWRPVGRREVERILRLNEASRKWDQSALDITCPTGCLILFLVGGMVAGVAYVLQGWPILMVTWITDAVLLLLPQWVTGVRRILTRPGLIIKVQSLLAVAEAFQKIKAPNEAVQWMMQLRQRAEGELPEDVKLMIKYADAPEKFLGVQVQVSLNDVQGRSYPYLYCVVLARPGFGLGHFVTPDKDVTEEFQQQDEVELIVIRQFTTKTSGYYTKPKAQQEIFRRSVLKARLALEKAKSTKAAA